MDVILNEHDWLSDNYGWRWRGNTRVSNQSVQKSNKFGMIQQAPIEKQNQKTLVSHDEWMGQVNARKPCKNVLLTVSFTLCLVKNKKWILGFPVPAHVDWLAQTYTRFNFFYFHFLNRLVLPSIWISVYVSSNGPLSWFFYGGKTFLTFHLWKKNHYKSSCKHALVYMIGSKVDCERSSRNGPSTPRE